MGYAGWCAVAVVSTCLGLAISWSPVIVSLAAIAIAASVLVLASPRARPMVPYVVGLLLAVFATSAFVSVDAGVVSIVARAVGFSMIFVAALASRADTGSVVVPPVRWLAVWLGGGLAAYLIAGALIHGQATSFIFYGLGAVLLALTGWALSARVDRRLLEDCVLFVLAVVVGASLAAGFVLPAVGIENGRVRGVLENANSLGFLAFLLAAVAVGSSKSWITKAACLTLSGAALLASSSRASAVATVLFLGLLAARRPGTQRVFVGLVALVGIGIGYLWRPDAYADLFGGVLRLNNSRSGSWAEALRVWDEARLFGVGMGNEINIVASSPLRAFVHAGMIGVLAVLVMWLALLVVAVRGGNATTVSFALAAIVHSVFEGWLLSPVGPLLWLFMLSWVTMSRERHLVPPSLDVEVTRAARGPWGDRRVGSGGSRAFFVAD